MKSHFRHRLLVFSPLLVWMLLGPLPARPQGIARIDLVVVGGEGVTLGVRQRPSSDPSVRVEDEDHRPVAGASVVFALPVSGTSGEFGNGQKTLTMVTGPDGLATAPGLRANDVAGKLQIYVTASYRGQRARVLISQVVEAARGSKTPTAELRTKSGGKWKWVLLGLVAGGGAGAGVYYGRRTTTAAPVSISAGSVVFGSPR